MTCVYLLMEQSDSGAFTVWAGYAYETRAEAERKRADLYTSVAHYYSADTAPLRITKAKLGE